MGFVWTLVGLVVVASATASGAWAKDGQPKPVAVDPTTILVKFESSRSAPTALTAHGDRAGGKTSNGVTLVKLDQGEAVAKKVAEYRADARVAYAEPNYLNTLAVAAPNDPSFSSQWGLAAIRAVNAWTIHPGAYGVGGGPKIAVIDTGVHSPHGDLAANVETASGADCGSGVCFADAGLDEHGHGTHVAGIAAASTNNGIGVAGTALSSPIVPIDVFPGDGASDAAVASGISWAVGRGVRVINLSLGRQGPFATTVCNAVANANAAGVLVVAAAGNEGTTAPTYPAACPGAIGIAATDIADGSPDWSNWGSPNVFISGPGVGIYSTYVNGGYATFDGTSMASPHVAGVAALLFGQNPTRSTAEVKRILAQSARKVGPVGYGADPYGTCAGCTWHPFYGYGLVDAAAALAVAPAPRLEAFSPFSGPVNSTVTLYGTNLDQVTQVSLGNQFTPFSILSPTQIQATVPVAAASFPEVRWRVHWPSGVFVHDTPFQITGPRPPTISNVTPSSGPVGQSVTITGTNFGDTTDVTLGFVPATFSVDSPTQITATVPAGAAGLGMVRWRVTNPLGTALYGTPFEVTSPTPTFTSFSPGSGTVGSTVRLTGTNLDLATGVSLGNQMAQFTIVSPTRIDAVVPAAAAQFPEVRWRVHWAGGVLLHDTPFAITGVPQPPLISTVTPGSGPVGSSVTITGSNFADVTEVTLGFVPATFTVDSPTQITATVPAGAAGLGMVRWRVTNPAGTALFATPFEVTLPTPTFASFSPGSGPVGSTVELTGTNLDLATGVSLGNQTAQFTIVSPTRIDAVVPAAAAQFPEVRWRVHWAGGVLLHDTPFAITGVPQPPLISTVTPGSGPVGSSVTINGSNFADVTGVTLGFVAAVFTVDSPTQITAVVPAGAAGIGTVRWRVSNAAGTALHPVPFEVTVPTPTLDSFSPGSGPVGSTVQLSGTSLDQVTGVSLGNQTASFTIVSPTRIDAVVPAAAAQFPEVRWRVHWSSGVAVHDTPFVITNTAPTITNVTPGSGPVGSTVTITGTNLADVTAVTLGLVAASFTIDSPTQISATVPSGAAGIGMVRWRVRNPSGTALWPTPFEISGPTISNFGPDMGPTGSSVVIPGSNFVDVTSVTLGGVSASYVVDSPSQITATVPAGVPGGKGGWRVTTTAGFAELPRQFFVARVWIDPMENCACSPRSDIVRVGVHDDAATGVVTFYVSEAWGSPAPGLTLYVYLDVDRNPATGQFGRDRRIQIGSDGVPHVRAWNGTDWNTSLPASTLTSTWLVSVTLKINRSELGVTGAGFDFSVETEFYASPPPPPSDHFDDRAPDTGTWAYDFGTA